MAESSERGMTVLFEGSRWRAGNFAKIKFPLNPMLAKNRQIFQTDPS